MHNMGVIACKNSDGRKLSCSGCKLHVSTQVRISLQVKSLSTEIYSTVPVIITINVRTACSECDEVIERAEINSTASIKHFLNISSEYVDCFFVAVTRDEVRFLWCSMS